MKLFLLSLVLFFSFACSANVPSISEKNTFNKVITAISSGDNSAISESEYDQILEYISSGKARWIDLYQKLREKPFTGVTFFQEGLDISMAYALTKNPLEVLKFVNDGNINTICGIPFIEQTQSETRDYYKKASSKIMAIKSNNLWKDKCLSVMGYFYRKPVS